MSQNYTMNNLKKMLTGLPFCMEFYRNGDLYDGIDPGIGVKFTF